MTNQRLGEMIGCHHSMASRLRAGERLPSVAMLRRITIELGIPADEALNAHAQGAKAFGAMLRQRIKELDRRVPVTT